MTTRSQTRRRLKQLQFLAELAAAKLNHSCDEAGIYAEFLVRDILDELRQLDEDLARPPAAVETAP